MKQDFFAVQQHKHVKREHALQILTVLELPAIFKPILVTQLQDLLVALQIQNAQQDNIVLLIQALQQAVVPLLLIIQSHLLFNQLLHQQKVLEKFAL